MLDEPIRNAIEGAAAFEPPPKPSLTAVTGAALLALKIPPRQTLLAPWLPERGLTMVYAPRGVGKTWLALGAAYAVASGGRFLTFTAPAPRPVLYLDGEMPAVSVQERLAQIDAASESKPPTADHLRFIAADLHPDGIPDLSTADGQEALAPHLDGVALVVLDNLSTLVRNGRENEADSWQPVQDWALRQRRAGRSVLFVHHAGKGGAQRGTSKREDVLDTVISLRRPDDYRAEQGARFEVHYEKARGFTGDDAKPFEAMCETRDGGARWSVKEVSDSELARVADLKAEGLSDRDIASETGLSKSKVNRLVSKAKADGLLDAA